MPLAPTPDVPPPPVPAAALDHLAVTCYDELRLIARRERRGEAALVTLDTAALVHEAYLRLLQQRLLVDADRPRFLAAAARTMRRVIIDHARERRALKRGGGGAGPITLDDRAGSVELREEHLLALDEALDRLQATYPRLARVVECRYFCGMTDDEVAAALGIAPRTVRRDWEKARGWLLAELHHA